MCIRDSATAVVGNCQGTAVFVNGDINRQFIPVQAGFAVDHSIVIAFVGGIAGVGDNFPQEDFFVGVDLSLIHISWVDTARKGAFIGRSRLSGMTLN